MALTPARFSRPAFAPGVSIVTEGASGIGRALATSLVQRGGRVIIADRDAAAASLASGPVLEQRSDMRNALHRAGEPADEGRFLWRARRDSNPQPSGWDQRTGDQR